MVEVSAECLSWHSPRDHLFHLDSFAEQVDVSCQCEWRWAQVREVAQEAVARARRGDGPTLIEAETYRFRGHSLADPDELRLKEEKEHYQARPQVPGPAVPKTGTVSGLAAGLWRTQSRLGVAPPLFFCTVRESAKLAADKWARLAAPAGEALPVVA